MRIGSLFSGIGGLDIGFEWEGFEVAWFCENNEFCRKILKKHWPGVPIYDDITKLDGKKCPKVDILTGGFPCQDISTAGKRAGIKEGTRSGLWFHYARVIGEVRPKYVIIENVPGLIGNGLDIVLDDLERLGYKTLQPILLEAATVGAPHKRERIFIVAHSKNFNGKRAKSKRHRCRKSEKEIGGRSASVAYSNSTRATSSRENRGMGRKRKPSKEDVANPKRGRIQGERQDDEGKPNPDGSGEATANAERGLPQARSLFGCEEGADIGSEPGRGGWWQIEPSVGRVASRVPDRMDRLKALGNAVVPQCAQVIAKAIKYIHYQLTGEMI